ncbi:MAG: amidase family protein [Treponema sp.]|nr:amidase family protein [Treponema sp.]
MFTLEEATIADMREATAAGEISHAELALEYIERIARIDSGEGGLNSVLEINPEALATAGLRDEERAKGLCRGALHGIPILLKDNICTGDKTRTSAGSLALSENFARRDADVARRLRASGAVILGKANMTEFANFMSEGMANGYSSRGGQVVNPYEAKTDPSGSSTGSAVAVAANLCAASVGTETHGSINAPACANGVVGIKPSAGLLSGRGIIPISCTLDTPGPMARTVTDAAILLGACMKKGADYARGLESSSCADLRLGVLAKEGDGDDEEFSAALALALREMQKSGAIIVDENIPGVTPEHPWHYIGSAIAHGEFRRCMDHFLSQDDFCAGTQVKSLAEIARFNEERADLCLKYGQSVFLECLGERDALTGERYAQALRRREKAIRDLDTIFEARGVNILVGAAQHMGIAPIAGFPSGTLPFGQRTNGAPMGLYLIARRFREAELVRAMRAAEKVVGKRREPPARG